MGTAERTIWFLNSGEPRLNSLLGQGLKRHIPIFNEGTEQLSAFQGCVRQRERISCYQIGSHRHRLLSKSFTDHCLFEAVPGLNVLAIRF